MHLAALACVCAGVLAVFALLPGRAALLSPWLGLVACSGLAFLLSTPLPKTTVLMGAGCSSYPAKFSVCFSRWALGFKDFAACVQSAIPVACLVLAARLLPPGSGGLVLLVSAALWLLGSGGFLALGLVAVLALALPACFAFMSLHLYARTCMLVCMFSYPCRTVQGTS